MRILKTKTVFISILFIFSSCQYNNQEEVSVVCGDDYREEKIALNREFVRRENADIELIARRYEWNLTRTESGLYYEFVNQTKGEYPKKGNIVKIKGSIMLANGKEVYNSETDGIKEFVVEQSEEPVGLHELVKLMRVGEKANAIIPSNLAFGTSGDGVEIPPASSLVCKLELVSIK
jgi:FKBP-type peptidyl-prolyl cis-trans isomerase